MPNNTSPNATQDAHSIQATHICSQMAAASGFALCGVAEATPSPRVPVYQDWLDRDEHGQMSYMQETQAVRSDPKQLVPNAQSIICLADRYHHSPPSDNTNQSTNSQATTHLIEQPTGHFARYAWGRDYHKVIKKRLFEIADALEEKFPGYQFRCTTDTAPLLERDYAVAAGLGWIGKHTLLINPKLGSWLLLGCIVTDLPMATTGQATGQPDHKSTSETGPSLGHGPIRLEPDRCGTCTRCIDACPTQAIDTVRRTLHAKRCVSYLTLEHRDLINSEFWPGIGDWIGGCDICQAVCPHQHKAEQHHKSKDIHPDYAPRDHAGGLALLDVLQWTEEDRHRVLSGTSMMRMKLPMILRNAMIAASNYIQNNHEHSQSTEQANTPHQMANLESKEKNNPQGALEVNRDSHKCQLIQAINELAQHPNELVRQTAQTIIQNQV